MRNKKNSMKAQASIEFMCIFPIFMVLVLALIAVALQWHAFHVTAQGSLESASKGLSAGNNAAWGEAPYADIEIHKSGDAKVSTNVIETGYSTYIGYSAEGTAKNIMVNENYFNDGNPYTSGYVQAPSSWQFIPCDIGCN